MSSQETEEKASILPKKRSRVKDMTSGSIYKLLLEFALPLLVGNLFQQLYNTVDTWVLGNFAAKEAFAAIGTISPVFNLFVNTFVGLANGAGVVISNHYGAGRIDKVKRTVHTAIVIAAICSVGFTAAGLLCKDTLIGFMKPAPEMIPHAQAYLSIIFRFLTFQIFYNTAAAIMRAVGDSRRPFYYLVIACVINIVLDLYFVRSLGMGAAGVAYATVIAQGISAALAVIALLRETSCIKLSLKELCLDREISGNIFRIGIPTAVQMAVVSFSNVFVMSYINSFGTDFSSGYTAYLKTEMLLFMPLSSISIATTTFVGQNFGAGNIQRAKKGVNTSIGISFIPTLLFGIPIYVFAPHIIAFFNSDPVVVEMGAYCLRFCAPFYLIQCFSLNYASALRGVGDSFVPMLIQVGCFVVIRQIYLFVMTNYFINTPLAVIAGFPVGWVSGCILNTIRYFRTDFKARFDNQQKK